MAMTRQIYPPVEESFDYKDYYQNLKSALSLMKQTQFNLEGEIQKFKDLADLENYVNVPNLDWLKAMNQLNTYKNQLDISLQYFQASYNNFKNSVLYRYQVLPAMSPPIYYPNDSDYIMSAFYKPDNLYTIMNEDDY